jgi:hypothetical protein
MAVELHFLASDTDRLTSVALPSGGVCGVYGRTFVSMVSLGKRKSTYFFGDRCCKPLRLVCALGLVLSMSWLETALADGPRGKRAGEDPEADPEFGEPITLMGR